MSAPRIEALLVSLVVLIAAGIALAAAYAPPLPRQPQTIVQETSPEEAEASMSPPTSQRNDDGSAASEAALSVIDAAVQRLAGMTAEVRIALLVMSGAASAAIVAVRRRRRALAGEASLRGRPVPDRVCDNGMTGDLWHVGTPPRGRLRRYRFFWQAFLLYRPFKASGCANSPFFRSVGEGRRGDEGTQASECGARLSHPTHSTPEICERTGIPAEDQRSAPARNWGATVRRWSKSARKRAQVWTGAIYRMATLPGIYRRVQHWNHVRSQPRKRATREETSLSGCGERSSPLCSSPSANTDEKVSFDQATDDHRLTAASQRSWAQPEFNAAEDPMLTTDSAAAAIATVLDVYERHGLTQSEVVFAEASVARQRTQVRLIIAAHPDDAGALEDLPDQIQTTMPESRAQWQRTAQTQPALMITMRGCVPAMRSGRLLLPVARRLSGAWLPAINRNALAVSFLPLRAWRHIGFYGSKAVDSASAAIIDLLYAEAPDALAVTILDQGQISSLCKGAPHLVPMPGAAAALNALGRSARLALPSDATVRPVLIVIVEPDATLLDAYDDLTTRLLRRPDSPVYTMLVQTRMPDVARRPPPSLPAVITGSGSGWLTGAGRAPSPGTVRILAPHMRLERQCHVYDAARLAALSGVLRAGSVQSLRPTVWDIAGAS